VSWSAGGEGQSTDRLMYRCSGRWKIDRYLREEQWQGQVGELYDKHKVEFHTLTPPPSRRLCVVECEWKLQSFDVRCSWCGNTIAQKGFSQVMRVGGSHLYSMQWSMTQRRHGPRHCCFSDRYAPRPVIARLPVSRHFICSFTVSYSKPRNCMAAEGLLRAPTGVGCRSMCPITMDEHHPLRNAQTSTVTPVPGRRVMHNICFGYTTANLQVQALHSGTPTLLPAAPNNTANIVPRLRQSPV
jgi:hypothetical protein